MKSGGAETHLTGIAWERSLRAPPPPPPSLYWARLGRVGSVIFSPPGWGSLFPSQILQKCRERLINTMIRGKGEKYNIICKAGVAWAGAADLADQSGPGQFVPGWAVPGPAGSGQENFSPPGSFCYAL